MAVTPHHPEQADVPAPTHPPDPTNAKFLSGPRARLGPPAVVDLPRPRSVAQLAEAEDARRVHAKVVEALTASFTASRPIARSHSSLSTAGLNAAHPEGAS